MNRKLADALSDVYFVHTVSAKRNLEKENLGKGRIFITGNTVIDALCTALEKNMVSASLY